METTQPSPQVKVALHQLCMAYADECIRHAQHAMEDARQSANNETKSSAGDKHETGRALLQLEQEKNTRQLMEAKESKERLLKIDPLNISSIISLGSVVITSSGNFYIAIAAGKLENEGIPYFAISPVSPIAMQFLGHRENDIVTFNGRTYEIRYIL
jgi:transcription elongation GreA/GreB family factor